MGGRKFENLRIAWDNATKYFVVHKGTVLCTPYKYDIEVMPPSDGLVRATILLNDEDSLNIRVKVTLNQKIGMSENVLLKWYEDFENALKLTDTYPCFNYGFNGRIFELQVRWDLGEPEE